VSRRRTRYSPQPRKPSSCGPAGSWITPIWPRTSPSRPGWPLQLTEEIKDLDERTALLLRETDPTGIVTSAPGVATITAAAILGRLGDPNRFTSLAGARAFTGLVPLLDASGLNDRHGGPTKRGDAVLRQALFMAAGQARRIDPTLAAKYHRLMTDAGKHHNSALCHIATTLS
jgi:transposase